MKDLSIDTLNQLIDYDPNTGIFIWKKRDASFFHNKRIYASWNGRYAGTNCGNKGLKTNYIKICVLDNKIYAHIAAWAIMTGEWPNGEIDHINLDRSDNRFCNLRVATKSQNASNAKIRKNNKSGFKGVCLDKRRNLWKSEITLNYKTFFLGYYSSPIEAHQAYCQSAEKLHGEFARMQ